MKETLRKQIFEECRYACHPSFYNGNGYVIRKKRIAARDRNIRMALNQII